MDVISGAKPVDLHPAFRIDDIRTYECPSCGLRRSNDEVTDLGGLCPNDGVIFRPLGPFQKHEHVLTKDWMLRKTA